MRISRGNINFLRDFLNQKLKIVIPFNIAIFSCTLFFIVFGQLSGFSAYEPPVVAEGFSEPTGWAPGTINPKEGTIQFEVIFKQPSKDIKLRHIFIFQMLCNRLEDGTHSLAGLVFCPEHEVREGTRQSFLWITRNSENNGQALVANPGYLKDSRHLFTVTWGNEKLSLWADGKKLAESTFKGALGQLPYYFKLGNNKYFKVLGMNISDKLRSNEYCGVKSLSAPDSDVTLSFKNVVLKNQTTDWQRKTFEAFAFPVKDHADFSAYSDESLNLPFCTVNFTDAEKQVYIVVECRDISGKVVANQKLNLKILPNTTYKTENVKISPLGVSGYMDARITVSYGANKEVYDHQFIVMPKQFRAPDGKIQDMLGHHHRFDFRPDVFTKLGVLWHRHWAKSQDFIWDKVEPEQGKFVWDKADFIVSQALKRNVKLLGLLGYPPKWASTFSPEEMERMKKLGSTNVRFYANPQRYKPKDIKEWENYIRHVVRRYKDKVKFWEIYNEIDYHPYGGGKHATFSGTTKEYFELLKSAYIVIKKEDPEAQVVISGFNLNPATNRNMSFELLDMGAAKYFDKFAVHGYADKALTKRVLDNAKKVKPEAKFWQTEICFLKNGSPDLRQKCQDMNNTFFWFLDEGVEKYFWHGGEFSYGTYRAQPEYASLGMLWTVLRSSDKYEGHLPSSKNYPWLNTWRFIRTDGKIVTIFGITKGSAKLELSFPSDKKQVTVTDIFGEVLYSGTYDQATFPKINYICYVLSDSPFTIKSATREVRNLFMNAGFEELEGDTSMGWENARPARWTLRDKFDPEGKIGITKSAESGEFALSLTLSKTGERIYVFQNFNINRKRADSAGKYLFSAQVKNEDKIPLTVKLTFYDCGAPKKSISKKFKIKPDTKFVKIELSVEWTQENLPEGVLCAMITLQSPGGPFLVDDVVLIKK